MDFKHHSVILLLKIVPKEELPVIKKFISSPYFNTNNNINKIFNEITKFYPEFDHKNFRKDFIYKKVFGDKPYNDSNMRWVLSELVHLIEKYFAQKHFDNDILMKDFYLSTEYFGAMNKDLVRKALNKAGKNIEEAEEKDYLHFLHKYIYETNELNYIMIFRNDKKAREMDFYYKTFLKALISYINHFIIGITYDYLNAEMLVSKYLKNGISKKINDIIKILNFQKIADFIDKNNEDSDKLHALIKMLNMFLTIEDDSLYSEAREYLKRNESGFNYGENASYYSKLISYCRLKIIYSSREEFYRNELFEITKIFFDKKYYLDGRISFLSPVLYKLALNNILELGEYDFANKFIEKYGKELQKVHRENALNYGKAMISFYNNDFDLSLHFSSKLSGDYFLTDQKALRIALFVEKGFYNECAAEVKAFKKFLKINKFLSPSVIESMENFLYFIPYINRTKNKNNMISKKRLREVLIDKKRTHFRNWIEKKIERL